MTNLFTVKDSGVREEYSTGMKRDTQDGKPRYDLVIPLHMDEHMLKRWAIHMTKGAQKYGDRNWELACTQEEADRFRASAFRHFIQWIVSRQHTKKEETMFEQLNNKIKSGEKMTKQERDAWHRKVGDSNEYTIKKQHGESALQRIMNWWYQVCDEQNERGG